jgi:hypothetical protein
VDTNRLIGDLRELWEWHAAQEEYDECFYCRRAAPLWKDNPTAFEIEHEKNCPFGVLAELSEFKTLEQAIADGELVGG